MTGKVRPVSWRRGCSGEQLVSAQRFLKCLYGLCLRADLVGDLTDATSGRGQFGTQAGVVLVSPHEVFVVFQGSGQQFFAKRLQAGQLRIEQAVLADGRQVIINGGTRADQICLGITFCPQGTVTLILSLVTLLGLSRVGQYRIFSGSIGTNRLPATDDRGCYQHSDESRRDCHCRMVLFRKLAQTVSRCRRAGLHWFVVEVAPQVGCQAIGRLVTTVAILLERLHDDPVELAAHQPAELLRLDISAGCD